MRVNAEYAFGLTEVCVWAKSAENEVQKKGIYFEVCGSENVTLTNSSMVQYYHSV